jgi:hypothetical protein
MYRAVGLGLFVHVHMSGTRHGLHIKDYRRKAKGSCLIGRHIVIKESRSCGLRFDYALTHTNLSIYRGL